MQSIQSRERVQRRVITQVLKSQRTIISDDKMTSELNGFVNKLRLGNDINMTLSNLSFNLRALDTIQPLINSGVVEAIFEHFDKFNKDQQRQILDVLLIVCATTYKTVIAVKKIESLMKILRTVSNELNRLKVLGILKEFLDIEESVSEKILKLGGMELILNAFESKNEKILSECSIIILRIVLYGGKGSLNIFLKHRLSLWVLPLIHIYEDRCINYFLYFSLIYLRSFHKVRHEFIECGFLDNIIQWLSENEHELRGKASFDCKDKETLYKILLDMLTSKNRMAQTFGTFQLYCEISSNFDNSNVVIFTDMQVIKALRRIAVYSNTVTSQFAISTLNKLTNLIDSQIQRFPLKSISVWNESDVQKWLKIFGFQDYSSFFLKVNGLRLMEITEHELKTHYFMIEPSIRKQFMEERSILGGESSSKMVKSLQQESVFNSCAHTENMIENGSLSIEQKNLIIDRPFNVTKRKYDAFISYRRQGGSDLASLIYIYLKGKKLRVFFDVQSLCAGKFADKLKHSIQQSKNFILLLTKDALSRCKDEGDWIAIEIEMALKSNCNIIPVTKDFDNNSFNEDKIPENIRNIKEYNQIQWYHTSQDSCLLKIVEFMEERDISCPSLMKLVRSSS